MNTQIRNLQECYRFCEAISHNGRREVVQHAILLGLEILAKEPSETRDKVDLLALITGLDAVLSAPRFLDLLARDASAEALTLAALKGMLSRADLGDANTALILSFLERTFAKPVLIRNLMGVGSKQPQGEFVGSTGADNNDEWITERDLKQLAEEAAQPIPHEMVELIKAEREKCRAFVDEFSRVFGAPLGGQSRLPKRILFGVGLHPAHSLEWREVKMPPVHDGEEEFVDPLVSLIKSHVTSARITALAACIGAAGSKIAQVSIADALNGRVSFDWSSSDASALSGAFRRDSN